ALTLRRDLTHSHGMTRAPWPLLLMCVLGSMAGGFFVGANTRARPRAPSGPTMASKSALARVYDTNAERTIAPRTPRRDADPLDAERPEGAINAAIDTMMKARNDPHGYRELLLAAGRL